MEQRIGSDLIDRLISETAAMDDDEDTKARTLLVAGCALDAMVLDLVLRSHPGVSMSLYRDIMMVFKGMLGIHSIAAERAANRKVDNV